MNNGQVTKVLYQQSQQEFTDFIQNYYSERGDSLPNLFESGASIFDPLLVEGIRLMDEEDLSYVSSLAEHATPEDLTEFYSYIRQSIRCTPAVEKISFTWRIYRDYPQL